MNIIFYNNTAHALNLIIDGISHILTPKKEHNIDIRTNSVVEVFINSNSTLNYLIPNSRKMVNGYIFNVSMYYKISNYTENSLIYLNEKKAEGNNFETYKYVEMSSDNALCSAINYRISDELEFKNQINEQRKKRKKNNRFWNILDFLHSVIFAVIPIGVLFLFIAVNMGLYNAIVITIPILIIGLLLGIFVKKVLKKSVKKREKKIGNIYSYLDTDVYFDAQHIYAVITQGDGSSVL